MFIEILFKIYFSNQIKSLLLSHHHSTSALVSEILTSVLQTVQKNNNNLHMDSTYLHIYFSKGVYSFTLKDHKCYSMFDLNSRPD